jgi:hypothetical protein
METNLTPQKERNSSELQCDTYMHNLVIVGAHLLTCPDRPWGPPSLLYNGYRVFPGGKARPGRAADHSPPSSAMAMEE